jgi:hypothetical protein
MDEYDESSIETMPVEEDMNGPKEALGTESRVRKLTYLIDIDINIIVRRVNAFRCRHQIVTARNPWAYLPQE